MGWDIHTADVMDWAASYDGPKFHALLCDPPYHLTSVKRLSRSSVSQEPATLNDEKLKQSGAARFFKSQAGFMGKKWDGGDVAFRPETWAALAEHLHPGAFGMAFASSRGWHRLAVAIEDSGMIIQPSIFGWATGQSFPKATRIDTQIDKRKGYKPGFVREVVTYLREARDKEGMTNKGIDDAFGFNGMAGHWCGFSQPEIPRLEYWPKLKQLLDLDDSFDDAIEAHEREVVGKHPNPNATGWVTAGKAAEGHETILTAPATPLARAWAGHRYGGQVLKNSLEPIIVFQKPWQGKRLDCIVETGAGSMWVDGGRIGTEILHRENAGYKSSGGILNITDEKRPPWTGGQGRWPSNFTLTHSAGCRQIGTRRVRGTNPSNDKRAKTSGSGYEGGWGVGTDKRATSAIETVTAWDCVPECVVRRLGEMSGPSVARPVKPDKIGKSGDGDNKGLFGMGSTVQSGYYDDDASTARFYFQADWSYEIAERLVMADPVCYQAKASRTERESGLLGVIPCAQCGGLDTETHVNDKGKTIACRRCSHPTVKPISLTRWLATLLLPPPEYTPRRLLIPFSGSGSEGIGAGLAGWGEMVLIDLLAENNEIAEARLTYWLDKCQLELEL